MLVPDWTVRLPPELTLTPCCVVESELLSEPLTVALLVVVVWPFLSVLLE
jgi:hypothetical protein